MNVKPQRYRLFEYAPWCVMAGRIIDDQLAESRGLIERDGRGISRVSDDLIQLGNYTERGWKRVAQEVHAKYFGA